MDEVYFNVSYKGLHLFRTDHYCQSHAIEDIEMALKDKFRRQDGYKISKHSRSAIVTVTELHND